MRGVHYSLPVRPLLHPVFTPVLFLQHLNFFYSLPYRGGLVFPCVPTTCYRLAVTSPFPEAGHNIKKETAHSSLKQPFCRMVPQCILGKGVLLQLNSLKEKRQNLCMEPVSQDILEIKLSPAQVDKGNNASPDKCFLHHPLLAQTTSHRTFKCLWLLRGMAKLRRGWKPTRKQASFVLKMKITFHLMDNLLFRRLMK